MPHVEHFPFKIIEKKRIKFNWETYLLIFLTIGLALFIILIPQIKETNMRCRDYLQNHFNVNDIVFLTTMGFEVRRL